MILIFGMIGKLVGGGKGGKGTSAPGATAQESANADATQRRREALRAKQANKKAQRRAQMAGNTKSLKGTNADYSEKFDEMASKVKKEQS